MELLGSYTYKGTHNLLFPTAGGDLEKLLHDEKSDAFGSEYDYVFALSSLSSAIEKLHNYASDTFDVKLIGCHHDLRPQNILVEKGKLLLADFGLSKFKKASENSQSPFGIGSGWYLAPECEDADKDFEHRLIGRSSDIWSFGCIMAELVTYMLRCADGVKEFQKRRRVKLGGWLITYTFHAGKCPNDGVQTWLEDLSGDATPVSLQLINLVNKVLQIDPIQRPGAKEVTACLRQLALESRFRDCKASFELLEEASSEFVVEKERFVLWAEALGLAGADIFNNPMSRIFETDVVFEENSAKLTKVHEELLKATKGQDDSNAPFLKLRVLNDDLLSLLPPQVQLRIRKELEHQIVSTHDLDWLKKLGHNSVGSSTHHEIGVLAAMKHMLALCENPPTELGEVLRIDEVVFQNSETFKEYEIATMCNEGGEVLRKVLLEKVIYDADWLKIRGKRLLVQVGAIVKLLQSVFPMQNLKVLECIGYHHKPSDQSFALIFRIPRSIGDPREGKSGINSLYSLIVRSQKKLTEQPPLEERFRLAADLALSLYSIHETGWLHKNFSSYAVLFLTENEPFPIRSLASPHIIGFNHSRPKDGISNKCDPEVLDYRHPEYLKSENRFQPEYDYFSFGLVLLEIGMWRTLKSMNKAKKGMSPEDLLETLLEEWVPKAGIYMGTTYLEIVLACLKGELGSTKPGNQPLQSGPVHIVFYREVFEKLDRFRL